MIKVEHTKTHKTTTYNNKTFGGILMEVNTLAADAELVLVKVDGKDAWFFKDKEGKLQHHDGYGGEPREYFKPIYISRTEKIEVGDWVYNSKNKTITRSDYNLESYEDFEIMKYLHKILALPEHFSPQILSKIVSGELKDGDKVLLEVEEI